MTNNSEQAWTQRNLRSALDCLDHALARAAESYYLNLQRLGFSRRDRAEKIDSALEDLEKLLRSRQSPDYDNPWVALFHFLWYQPKQIRVAYRAARKILARAHPGQDVHIFDFGCGSLSMQFGLVLALADQLDGPGAITPIKLHNYDIAEPMIELGRISWDTLMSDNIPGCDDIRYVNNELLTAIYYSSSDAPTPSTMNTKESMWYVTALHCFYKNRDYEVLAEIFRTLNPDVAIFTAHASKRDTLHRVGALCIERSGFLHSREEDEREGAEWRFLDLGDPLRKMYRFRTEILEDNRPLRKGNLLESLGDWNPRPIVASVISRREERTPPYYTARQ